MALGALVRERILKTRVLVLGNSARNLGALSDKVFCTKMPQGVDENYMIRTQSVVEAFDTYMCTQSGS